MLIIEISSGELTLQAELNESPTAQEIWKKLPLEGRANAKNYSSSPKQAAINSSSVTYPSTR